MNELRARCESLLDGFEPTFRFEPAGPLPPAEYAERMRRIRREAAVLELDALILHTDIIGWYHASNSYLRYACDWMREGALVIPTDMDREPVLLSFFSDAVLLPPPGEPVGIDDIRQVGPLSREGLDRPGDPARTLAVATEGVLSSLNHSRGRIGLVGDFCSAPYFSALARLLPDAQFQNENRIIDAMQRIRSPREQVIIRKAAQLIDIGLQAAYHVAKPGVTDYEIYAAFTFAQMARGGETGDGYQIGISPSGTHTCKPYGHVVREGDVINLYISNVTYRGYVAQTARMITVGKISPVQEEVIEMCAEGVEAAIAAAQPGVLIRDVNAAAFEPFIARGYLSSSEARKMPWNWEPLPDGSPRPIRQERVACPDWEAQGRDLRHVYPTTPGPNGPRLGHTISMPNMPIHRVISSNHDRLEPGMALVFHSQWFEPKVAGCNIGNAVLITESGCENLNAHTDLRPHRISV